MKKRFALIEILFLVFIIASISFILSDSPDKKYLNPYYVDIVVSIAGIFLIIDAFFSLRFNNNFILILTRASIGMAIITIHLWQFVFDRIRYFST